jgi:hypothetical protein
MVRRACYAALALFSLACAGCGESDPTEVVLVITGDYAVPSELDRLVVQIRGPEGTVQTVTDTLEAGDAFPRTLGIHNPDGPLGPFQVQVNAFRGTTPLVRALAVFDFEEDRSLEVDLELLHACETVTCLCGDVTCATCGAGGACKNAIVDPRPFDGVGKGRGSRVVLPFADIDASDAGIIERR